MYCTNCGTDVGRGAQFCPNCGTELATTARQQVQQHTVPASPLFSFENLKVYPDGFSVDGTFYPFSIVTAIKGGGTKDTINFLPIRNESNLIVRLDDGQEFTYAEEGRFLKGSRHKAIQTAYAVMRKATFNTRMARLVERLRKDKVLEVNSELDPENPYLRQVLLYCDGLIESHGIRINLKLAKDGGVLWCGTQTRYFPAQRYSFSPDIIVLSEFPPPRFGDPKQSITFYPIKEDVDVTQALVEWLGEKGHTLC